jgi:hypothetical protein
MIYSRSQLSRRAAGGFRIRFPFVPRTMVVIVKAMLHQRHAKIAFLPHRSVRLACGLHFFFHLPYFGSQTVNASAHAAAHDLHTTFQILHYTLDPSY